MQLRASRALPTRSTLRANGTPKRFSAIACTSPNTEMTFLRFETGAGLRSTPVDFHFKNKRFYLMASLPVLVLNSGSSSIKFAMYDAGNGQRTKLHEGAVDGIGTDNGKFWIKDAEGKKVVDQAPAL